MMRLSGDITGREVYQSERAMGNFQENYKKMFTLRCTHYSQFVLSINKLISSLKRKSSLISLQYHETATPIYLFILKFYNFFFYHSLIRSHHSQNYLEMTIFTFSVHSEGPNQLKTSMIINHHNNTKGGISLRQIGS